MRRILFELAITALSFFGIWFLLSQVDYVTVFKLKERTYIDESRLGEIFWKNFSRTEHEVTDSTITIPLLEIKNTICEANGISPDSIKLHVFENSEVNAFAMPAGHLVVYTGLITDCKNPEELAGVVAHEIAHIMHKHVMKKLVKEVGIAVVASLISGNSGSEIIAEVIRLTSSTAYDRTLETEADAAAVGYLANAGINPEHFANFLLRLSTETDLPQALVLINTHPNSKDRVAALNELIQQTDFQPTEMLNPAEWEELVKRVKML